MAIKKNSKPPLTPQRLREVLSYDPNTGVLTWLVASNGRVRVGGVAGCVNEDGYRLVGIDGRIYRANRLIWLYMTGEWPTRFVDHRDRAKDDNRWAFLREASDSQNGANALRRKDNASGYKGVIFHKGARKFRASITKNGQRFYLGLFLWAEDAHAAYRKAAITLYGEFARW